MPFVIRTDKLGRAQYWAGVVAGNVGVCHAISGVVFNAWRFDDRAEAEKIISELGDAWFVSETTEGGSLKSMIAKGRA